MQLLINLPQKTSLKYRDNCDNIKTISRINHHTTHIFSTFQIIFCEKLSDFLLLGVTNIILALIFIRSNNFYYVQAAKVVKSKDVSC